MHRLVRFILSLSIFSIFCIPANLKAQIFSDTVLSEHFQYTAALAYESNTHDLLFLAGSNSRKYGVVDLAKKQVYCCFKPETRNLANKNTAALIGTIDLHGTVQAFYWFWDKEQQIVSIYTSPFRTDSAELVTIIQQPLAAKPASFFLNTSPNGNYIVIGFLSPKGIQAYLLNEKLEVEKKGEQIVTNFYQNKSTLSTVLNDRGVFYLAQLNNIGKRKATLRLIRWALKTNNFSSKMYANQKRDGYNFRRITDDFQIVVSPDDAHVALVSSLPQLSTNATYLKGLTMGFGCLYFNRQLKMVDMRDTVMNDILFYKTLGFNKETDPIYDMQYKLPIGSFKLRNVAFSADNKLVAVYEDTPTKPEYYYGNLVCITYTADTTVVYAIPKISKQAAQLTWQNDSLHIDYILDTREDEIINPDKNHRLRYYKSFNNTYKTDYAFITDCFYDGTLNNIAKMPLKALNEEVMAYTLYRASATLYIVIGEAGYKNNKLIVIRK